MSRCFFVQDGLLVLLALIAKFSLNHVLVGLISVFVCSWFVEITQVSGQKCYIAEIISDQYEAINQAILEKLDRGTTLFLLRVDIHNKIKLSLKLLFPKNNIMILCKLSLMLIKMLLCLYKQPQIFLVLVSKDMNKGETR